MSSAVRWLIWVGILLLGYFIGNWAMTHWNDYLLAQGFQVLGQADPLFGVDLGFYLFKLPFQWFLYHLALVTVLACLLSAVFLYMLEGTVWVTPRGLALAPAARMHLMILGALLFLVIAYRVRLAMYGLLFSPRGILYGAGYTDVNATLPVGIVMARAIRTYHERTGYYVGFKPAGGIRKAKESLDWLAMMKDELGDRWLRADLFRFGASGLLTDIERQLEHHVTGRYSAAHRHPLP